jgi:hypothetical protein
VNAVSYCTFPAPGEALPTEPVLFQTVSYAGPWWLERPFLVSTATWKSYGRPEPTSRVAGHCRVERHDPAPSFVADKKEAAGLRVSKCN